MESFHLFGSVSGLSFAFSTAKPVPPRTLYSQTSSVDMGSCDWRDTMMYSPSGSHAGEAKVLCLSWLICRAPDPSGLQIQTFSAPSRSLRNAIFLPSGENFGWLLNDMPSVICFAGPPAIGMV